MHAHKHAHTQTCMHTHTNPYMRTCTHAHTHLHTHTYAHTHKHAYKEAHAYMHTCLHTPHTHRHAHTHIHIHIHQLVYCQLIIYILLYTFCYFVVSMFQRQHRGNFCETGWSAYGLPWALRYCLELKWTFFKRIVPQPWPQIMRCRNLHLLLLLLSCSSAEHSEGHPVCAPTPVHVQVQAHCIGWEDCVRNRFQLPRHLGSCIPSSEGT